MRERQRPPEVTLIVQLPGAVGRLLQAASTRRALSCETLAALLLSGIVCKGSIDRTIAGLSDDTRPSVLAARVQQQMAEA